MQLQPKDPSWKKSMLKHLLDTLYIPARSRLEDEISILLEEHKRYIKAPTDQGLNAYFDGVNYHVPGNPPNICPVKYVDLDPKFHPSIKEILEDHKELNIEREEMKIFFRKVVNASISKTDVASLVPTSLYKAPLLASGYLTEKQIEKFLKENLYYTGLITQRMVENLLAK